ncbi:PKD domain-containing protein [Marinifilum sp.]|uniref:PKD domain-containing protein n=1 Tax=Marinifilum sp. TaxID=2033137 RepID=UPI003BA88B34
MKNLLSIIIIILLCSSLNAQNKKFSVKKHKKVDVKNIVITEKTYEDITNRTLNKRKLSNIADRESGKPKVADDPLVRRLFELQKLKNPATGKIPANIRELEKAYVLSAKSGLVSRTKSVGLNYTNSGPRNVGGRTRALAIDINDSSGNTILAGGSSGGMWKSTDKGKSWIRTTELGEHPSVTAIAQDPRAGQTSTWYYTTGEYIGSASASGAFYSGNGVFKSTNNGNSWIKLTSTSSDTFSSFDNLFDICWNICVDPNNGDVYVATYGGIYISKDGGNSWTLEIQTVDASLDREKRSYSSITDVICSPAGVKYATLSTGGNKNSGIWRKGAETNATWEEITPNNFPSNYRRIVMGHAPSVKDTDIVYFLAQTPGNGLQGHSFWKLTYDANTTTPATWEDRSQNLPEGGDGDRDVNGYNSQGSYNMIVKVAPDDENMVFIGGTNLFRSNDAFASKASPLSDGVTNNSKTYWIGGYATENNVSQYDNHHPDVHALVFIDNNQLLCGHDGGISLTESYKQSLDSGTGSDNKPVDWVFLNNSYLTTQAYTIAIDHDVTKNKYLLTGFQDNGTWISRNELADTDWTYWGSGDGSYASILDKGKHFLSSSQNGTVYLENDPDGPDSYYYTRVDPDGAEGQLFINPFIVDANNSEIMYYAAGQFVWRNKDIFEIPQLSTSSATVNWEKLEITKVSETVSALESSTYPAHILYFGTSDGKIYMMKNSHSSSAKVRDITGSNMPNGYVSSIDANPLNANEVIVSFSNYGIESIFHTTDGGANWQAISGNLEDGSDSGNGPSVRSVAIMVSPTDTTYFAGTSTGLYSTSTLNGSSTSWTFDAASKIGTTIVEMVKTRRDGFIAAATHGNGVFTADANYSSQAPKALIGMTADTIFTGDSINYFDRSIGDRISSYQWTFSGAETENSTEEHPESIKYINPGTFDVSLTVSNRAGSDTQTIAGAIVVKSVEAKFTASATDINVGDVVQFNNSSTTGNSAVSYLWTFPGGIPESSAEENPSVTYNTVGTYDVSLTISDSNFNDTETKTAYITVQDPDDKEDDLLYNVLVEDESKLSLYSFTGDENWGYTSGHNSFNMSEFAEKFEMINTNLNVVRSVQLNPVIIESKSSEPKIQLKIWNGDDMPKEEVYSKDILFSELQRNQFNEIVLNEPVSVENTFFVGYKIFYEVPVDTFAVYHLPIDGEITWNNSAYLKYNDTWYPFSSSTVYEANSALAVKVKVGYEEEPVAADFSANVITTTTDEDVKFNDLSTGSLESWEWIFEGGTADDNTLQNPTVSYNEAGTYDVSLSVVGTNGDTDTELKEEYITVEIATAINELGEEVENIRIYPNPMVNKSKIEFPNNKNQKYRLIVVDASGRIVRIIENITGNNVILNREQLKPGVHIINLSGEKLYKGKLIVK